MITTITICDTCRLNGREMDENAMRDGEKLAALVEEAAKGCATVQTRRQSCLMGCEFGCNIAIQAPDKLSYVLGTFAPDAEAAEGIVTYATLHSESETGQVPYKTWPQAVKGHFRARLPVVKD